MDPRQSSAFSRAVVVDVALLLTSLTLLYFFTPFIALWLIGPRLAPVAGWFLWRGVESTFRHLS